MEGNEIGCFFGMSGGIAGEAIVEEPEDDEDVFVLILRRGGATGRLRGGVTDFAVGGLGLLKNEGCAVVDVGFMLNSIAPLTRGRVSGAVAR